MTNNAFNYLRIYIRSLAIQSSFGSFEICTCIKSLRKTEMFGVKILLTRTHTDPNVLIFILLIIRNHTIKLGIIIRAIPIIVNNFPQSYFSHFSIALPLHFYNCSSYRCLQILLNRPFSLLHSLRAPYGRRSNYPLLDFFLLGTAHATFTAYSSSFSKLLKHNFIINIPKYRHYCHK